MGCVGIKQKNKYSVTDINNKKKNNNKILITNKKKRKRKRIRKKVLNDLCMYKISTYKTRAFRKRKLKISMVNELSSDETSSFSSTIGAQNNMSHNEQNISRNGRRKWTPNCTPIGTPDNSFDLF